MTAISKSEIFEHFAGRSTSLQKRQIEIWLESHANQELYFQWLIEWENKFPIYEPEIDGALSKYSQFIERASLSAQTVDYDYKKNNVFPALRYAAAILLLITAAGLWLGKDHIQYHIYETGYGATQQVLLSDGSEVMLNANSRLLVPRFTFGKQSRDVTLEGEAYFKVTHQKNNMTFRVKTPKNMDVVVLGTEFDVYARQFDSRVMLHKGKVEVTYPFNNTIRQVVLKPGDLIEYNRKSPAQVKSNVEPEKYVAWKDHRYVFEDMTLNEFGQLLLENYGLHLELGSSELGGRTLVGSFKADNSEELLTSVAEILNLKIIRKGNTILLQSN